MVNRKSSIVDQLNPLANRAPTANSRGINETSQRRRRNGDGQRDIATLFQYIARGITNLLICHRKESIITSYIVLQGAAGRGILRHDPGPCPPSGRSPPSFFPFGMNSMPNKLSPRSDNRQSNGFSSDLAKIFTNCRDGQPPLPFGMQAFPAPYSALFQQHLYNQLLLASASAAQDERIAKV